MPQQRYSLRVLALVLVAGLSTGVLVHAALPHEHGERQGAASIWQGLHAALRHEDKKTSLVLVDALALPFWGIDAGIAGMLILIALTIYARQKPFDARIDALRRGIVPYRKFG